MSLVGGFNVKLGVLQLDEIPPMSQVLYVLTSLYLVNTSVSGYNADPGLKDSFLSPADLTAVVIPDNAGLCRPVACDQNPGRNVDSARYEGVRRGPRP